MRLKKCLKIKLKLKPYEKVDIAKTILAFNRQNQEGQADQMLSRLPVTLAQLKAENNSEKPKNEIIQLLYSLYRSK